MGTKGKEIVGQNADKLIEMLNKAYSDEWLAYYQYWVGAKTAKGPMKAEVITELTEHAADELRHAGLVADRIIQLGGTPVTKPEDWYKWSNCGYDAPDDPFVKTLILQNIKGEQCAIGVYNDLLGFTKDIDPVTYNMVLTILQDEVEHEEDLQALMEDFELLKRS